MGWRGTWTRFGNAGLVLALLALLVRAAIPSGYMVAQDHGPKLVICSGHAVTPPDPGGKPSDDTHKPDPLCAFTGAHVALTAPAGPDLAPWTRLATETVTLHRPDLTPGRGLAAPPPPATGPPILL